MNSKLFQSWELYKEDSDNLLEFRKVNNRLLKHARNSIELKQNGEFIQHKVSAEGKVTTAKGRFKVKDNFIYVNFDNPYQDFIFNIIYYDDEILKVRK